MFKNLDRDYHARSLTEGGTLMPRESIALFRLHQPDFVLAPIVGAEPISRTEITKRVWAYIKANGAQNPDERRQIDATTPELRALFEGATRCTMFDLNKFVDSHLLPARSSTTSFPQDRSQRQRRTSDSRGQGSEDQRPGEAGDGPSSVPRGAIRKY